MKIVIDRFENNLVVVELENKDVVVVPKSIIPSNAKEGSVLTITCNEDETEKRRSEISEKMNSIFHK